MADRENLRAALAVFWGFFGVRKRREYEADAKDLTPAQIIVAGLLGALAFILTLLLVVYLVLKFAK